MQHNQTIWLGGIGYAVGTFLDCFVVLYVLFIIKLRPGNLPLFLWFTVEGLPWIGTVNVQHIVCYSSILQCER